jgi:hypothetical protein
MVIRPGVTRLSSHFTVDLACLHGSADAFLPTGLRGCGKRPPLLFVILSEAKNLSSILLHEKKERFFASLRMTK